MSQLDTEEAAACNSFHHGQSAVLFAATLCYDLDAPIMWLLCNDSLAVGSPTAMMRQVKRKFWSIERTGEAVHRSCRGKRNWWHSLRVFLGGETGRVGELVLHSQ